MAARVQGAQALATEVVAAAIDRAETVQPALNAVAVPLYEEAAAAAARLDGDAGARRALLAGVPVTVKESFEVAGTAACGGAEALAGARAARDAPVVAALRDAGALILAKGNLAQLMWFAETDNPVYGRTANPWALDRSPGGSSGGDAALVAAGVVPVAVGTDLGGSVRQPAHCCGIWALKPTPGRLSMRGTLDERLFAGFPWVAGQPGIFARDPADIELVLRALDAGAAGGGGAAPVAAASPAGMHVGVVFGNGVVEPAAPVRRAVDAAAAAAERAGAVAVAFTPPAAELALALFEEVFRADGGQALRDSLGGGTAHPRVAAAVAAARGCAVDAAGAAELEARIADYRRVFARAVDAHALDAVISPAYPVPAVPHGASGEMVSGQSYCSLWNLVGYPAGVVPVTAVAEGEEPGATGLPVGVQIAARAGREDAVLGLMRAVGSRPPGPPAHGFGR